MFRTRYINFWSTDGQELSLETEPSLWPTVWNSLPESVRSAETLASFKRNLTPICSIFPFNWSYNNVMNSRSVFCRRLGTKLTTYCIIVLYCISSFSVSHQQTETRTDKQKEKNTCFALYSGHTHNKIWQNIYCSATIIRWNNKHKTSVIYSLKNGNIWITD